MNVAAAWGMLRHEDLIPVLMLRRLALVGVLLGAVAATGVGLWSLWPWR